MQAAMPLQELGWRGGEAREGEITINECFIKAKNLHSMILLDGSALEHKKILDLSTECQHFLCFFTNMTATRQYV